MAGCHRPVEQVVKHGASWTATAFVSATVNGSAAEVLFGRRAMAERTSATDTSEKVGKEAPGRSAVNTGLGTPSVPALTGFLVKVPAEAIHTKSRTSW